MQSGIQLTLSTVESRCLGTLSGSALDVGTFKTLFTLHTVQPLYRWHTHTHLDSCWNEIPHYIDQCVRSILHVDGGCSYFMNQSQLYCQSFSLCVQTERLKYRFPQSRIQKYKYIYKYVYPIYIYIYTINRHIKSQSICIP